MRTWIHAAGVRAVKTVAQTAAATFGAGQVTDSASLKTSLFAAIGAGILSLLTSLAGLPEVKK
jgi:hypothetical protein